MTARRPLRVLFVNEGDLGGRVMGHVAVEASLRAGMAATAGTLHEIEPRFVRLPPMPVPTSKLAAALPLLHPLDLDFAIARWHAVQAVRTRRLVASVLTGWDADALHVDSHSLALALRSEMARRPTILSVDATVRQWQLVGPYVHLRPWSRWTTAPSRLAERSAFRHAAGVSAMSEWSACGVREEAPPANVRVLHPGIDLSTFRPDDVGRNGERPLRLLFVGGRFREKGGVDLVEAVAPWLGDDVVLDVVTGAEVPTRTGMTVHRLGNGDRRLVSLFQQADLLCLPSYGDAVPFVLAEALACGTPVLVSDVGALPTMFGDAGFVVRRGDVGAIRAAIGGFLADRSALATLRPRARAVAEQRYDSRRQGHELARWFHELAGAPRG